MVFVLQKQEIARVPMRLPRRDDRAVSSDEGGSGFRLAASLRRRRTSESEQKAPTLKVPAVYTVA
jgi:hypothetical protein